MCSQSRPHITGTASCPDTVRLRLTLWTLKSQVNLLSLSALSVHSSGSVEKHHDFTTEAVIFLPVEGEWRRFESEFSTKLLKIYTHLY